MDTSDIVAEPVTIDGSKHYKRSWSEFRWNIFSVMAGMHVLAVWGAVVVVERIFMGSGPVTWALIVWGLIWYFVTSFSITAGNHRRYTHKAYKASKGFDAVLLFLAPMTLQGGTGGWLEDHRRHHWFTDTWWDPHSPLFYRYLGGWWGIVKSWLYAHMGWINYTRLVPEGYKPPPESRAPLIKLQRRFLWVPIVITFLGPALIGAWSGLMAGDLRRALVGGWYGLLVIAALRIVVSLHVTWSVNSSAHLFGMHATNNKGDVYRADDSRNAGILLGLITLLLSLGERLHSNHHWQQNKAVFSTKITQVDPTGWFLLFLQWAGRRKIVWDVTAVDANQEMSLRDTQPSRGSLLWLRPEWANVKPWWEIDAAGQAAQASARGDAAA